MLACCMVFTVPQSGSEGVRSTHRGVGSGFNYTPEKEGGENVNKKLH